MQGYSFTSSFLLLLVSGCDLVLGVEWLDTLGYIGWHLRDKVMSFMVNGTRHVLRGLHPRSVRQDETDDQALFDLGLSYTSQPVHSVIPPDLPPSLHTLLSTYESLFSAPTGLPPHRPIDHKIQLLPNSSPVNVRPYKYAHSQKGEIEAQVREMLDQGIIRPSQRPFSSPVLLVRKKEGTWRFCVDYRELNAITVKDRFPIPVVDELLDELHGARVFIKLDLRAGYHQIRMCPDDIHKTAFRTHEGHYEFLVMSFGLSNAPSTFQALMNEMFKLLLRKCVLVFFDDILVFSKDFESHLEHLKLVFDILLAHEMKVKLSKCSFAQDTVTYLGHVVSAAGVAMDPEKVRCILEWALPQTIKGLRGVLGLAGYYRRFIQDYAQKVQPLTQMLKADSFHWTDESRQAFANLKDAITSAPVLSLPDFSHPFDVETDASGTGIGAVLSQLRHPIAFLSKVLSAKNQALSVYDKEMLAILFAVDKWRHYLLGHPFNIITDHQTLKHLLDQRITTPAQHKWLYKLMGHNYKIIYRPGKLNTAADVLSRQLELCSIQNVSAPIFDSLTSIDRACAADPSAQEITQALQQGQATKKNFELRQGRLYYKNRIFVPLSTDLRCKILDEFHSSLQGGHSGYLRTYLRLARNFAWPGMRKDVKRFVAACDQCQRQNYEALNPPGLLQPLPVPEGVWLDISLDFIEGLPLSDTYNCILVVVDRLTKSGHFIAIKHPYTTPEII